MPGILGLALVGPTLINFGTSEQKQRYLEKILSGEEVWCQGYSEPNAGSDLASLKLRAEPDGQGNYIMNGQKTWISSAHLARWGLFLLRTDPTAFARGANLGDPVGDAAGKRQRCEPEKYKQPRRAAW